MPLDIVSNKVAMIIASKDFRDEEYFVTREALESHAFEIVIFSDTLGIARGADGAEINVEKPLDELRPSDYDAIVFIGGSGALTYLDNSKSYEIAKEAVRHDKIVAAICIAPVILAKAGILRGRKATVHSSQTDNSAVKILQERGAIYDNNAVVIDDQIITANGAKAAQEFGEALSRALGE